VTLSHRFFRRVHVRWRPHVGNHLREFFLGVKIHVCRRLKLADERILGPASPFPSYRHACTQNRWVDDIPRRRTFGQGRSGFGTCLCSMYCIRAGQVWIVEPAEVLGTSKRPSTIVAVGREALGKCPFHLDRPGSGRVRSCFEVDHAPSTVFISVFERLLQHDIHGSVVHKLHKATGTPQGSLEDMCVSLQLNVSHPSRKCWLLSHTGMLREHIHVRIHKRHLRHNWLATNYVVDAACVFLRGQVLLANATNATTVQRRFEASI
jgi:hypothetical protein